MLSTNDILTLSAGNLDVVKLLSDLNNVYVPADLQITVFEKLKRCNIYRDDIYALFVMCNHDYQILLFVCKNLPDDIFKQAIRDLYSKTNPIRIKVEEYYQSIT